MSGQQDYEAAFDELIEKYYDADDTKAKTAALEEVIRLADSAGDLHGGFGARMELVQCGTFTDQKDKALVAFAWCLAQADKNPGELDDHSLLWQYKWVLENIITFADVPKSKILELQDDMQARLLKNGYNVRPIHFVRWAHAMRMGEMDRAREFLDKWKETTRDEMADCEACEQNKLSELYGRLGDAGEAIKCAAPMLSGEMTCGEVPHLTYGHLVSQYWKLGRVDEIKELQPTWYKILRHNSEFLEAVSEHLLLVAATGQHGEGLAMFERHAPWAEETVNDHSRCMFYRSAAVLFDQLNRQGQAEVKVRVPSQWRCANEEHRYQASELADWFEKESQALASQFNARNGNDYYDELLAESKRLVASLTS